MADAPAFTFAKLVPGFDFLQDLAKNAGSAMPNIGQWVAPTLNPEELEKRIEELRTVQFWLEQNARLLGATIQALEVQRMTLSTLRTMNVQMDDLRDSLKVRVPETGKAASAAAAAPEDAPTPKSAGKSGAARKTATAAKDAQGTPPVDPMQWWGALTKQFTQLATAAIKDSATDATQRATAMVKQGADTASQSIKKTATAPAPAARKSATASRKRKSST